MIPLLIPRRNMDVHSALIIAVLVGIAGLVPARQTLAQAIAYKVTELSPTSDAGQVPCRLNNLGDVAGRAGDSLSGQTQATIWNDASLRRRNLGNLGGGEYSSASDINDAGEVAGAANTGKAIVPLVWTATGGLRRVPLLAGDRVVIYNKDMFARAGVSVPTSESQLLQAGQQLMAANRSTPARPRRVNNQSEDTDELMVKLVGAQQG